MDLANDLYQKVDDLIVAISNSADWRIVDGKYF
jgi:hypothetical protein